MTTHHDRSIFPFHTRAARGGGGGIRGAGAETGSGHRNDRTRSGRRPGGRRLPQVSAQGVEEWLV